MKKVAAIGIFFILLIGSGCSTVGLETAVTPTFASATMPPIATQTQLPVNRLLANDEQEIVLKETETAVSPPSTLTPIPTSTAPPTATPFHERAVLGNSVQGQAIEWVRLGHGINPVVIMGALHGGHECNTHTLVEGIISRFIANPTLLPADVTLYAVPLINPDGCTAASRTNANRVDLNRNWDTPNWLADAEGPGGIQAGSGGLFPFSEPETAHLRDWLNALSKQYPEQSIKIISYHSVVPDSGLVQPGYSQPEQPNPAAMTLATTYAAATGYLYSNVWIGNYTITGEFIHWATRQGFITFDVELPDITHADSHIENNLQGLLAIMMERP